MGFENGRLVRVTMRAHAGSSIEQVNSFHYDLDDGDVPGEANSPQALADFFRDNVMGPFAGLYTNTFSIDPVIVTEEKDPQNPNAGRQQWQSGTTTAGTKPALGGDLYALAHCGVATLKTEHVGRRHTGRIFLGGAFSEGDVNNTDWGVGPTTLWQAYTNAIPREPDIAGGAGTASARWCVYSRTQRAGDFDPYASRVTTVIIHPRVHWLRSRDD